MYIFRCQLHATDLYQLFASERLAAKHWQAYSIRQPRPINKTDRRLTQRSLGYKSIYLPTTYVSFSKTDSMNKVAKSA